MEKRSHLNTPLKTLKNLKIPRHLWVAASAWLSRIIIMLLQLISIRILIGNLGVDGYAVFVLLISISGWYLLTDIGLGLALQNTISELRAASESYMHFIQLSTIIGVLIILLGFLIISNSSSYLGPIILKSAHEISDVEKARLFEIVGYFGLCTAIGGISYKIWYAEQCGYLANIYMTLASILGFLGILFINEQVEKNQILWNFILFQAPTAVIPIFALILQARFRKVTLSKLSLQLAKPLLVKASKFWLFAIMAALVLQVDYIIISQMLLPSDIVIYNLSTKIFTSIYFVYSAILLAIWPSFTEHLINKNTEYILNMIKKIQIFGFVFIISSTCILVFLITPIVNLLSPEEKILIPAPLILLLSMYFLIRAWTDVFGMALQSMSSFKAFWVYVPAQAALSIFFQWFFIKYFGIYGSILGLIISFLLTVSWGLPMVFKKNMRDMVRI